MSGFEATRAIRSLNPELQTLPIVALTASAIAETREQCLEAGMNDYLTKPPKIKQLKEKLNEWLERIKLNLSNMHITNCILRSIIITISSTTLLCKIWNHMLYTHPPTIIAQSLCFKLF